MSKENVIGRLTFKKICKVSVCPMHQTGTRKVVRWVHCMNHIVDTCPLTKFEGHEADDDAVMAGIYSDCSN